MTLTYLDLRARVGNLAKELPGVTFGYLGNVEVGPYYDDRVWYVFLPHPDRVGGPNDAVHLGRDVTRVTDEQWAAVEREVRVKYPLGVRV